MYLSGDAVVLLQTNTKRLVRQVCLQRILIRNHKNSINPGSGRLVLFKYA